MTSTKEMRGKTVSLTILLPAGRLGLPVLEEVSSLAPQYNLELYLSTAQNLRLMGIKEEDLNEIKERLAKVGAEFKGPGKFPLPKICVGRPHCNLGVIDTEALSRRITERFKDLKNVKPKFKIALSGCTLSCSGALLADIGIVATRKGFDIYAGGKGGPRPAVGRKICSGVSEDRVVEVFAQLVDFHDAKTGKKQRMIKLLKDPEFCFPVG